MGFRLFALLAALVSAGASWAQAPRDDGALDTRTGLEMGIQASRYFYFPLGFGVRYRLGGGWVFAPQLEYAAFANGNQRTYLSDTSPGFPDANNDQAHGYGNRGRLAPSRSSPVRRPFLAFVACGHAPSRACVASHAWISRFASHRRRL